MSQRKRLQAILDQLQSTSELTVDEACKLFDASPATIRRDFNLLTSNGEVEKTWGGIARKESLQSDMKPLGFRQTQHVLEKKAIAESAASLIKDGEVVIIDGGTTTFEMAALLANRKVRIITNSLLIAHEIHQQRQGWIGPEVFLTGGFLYPDSGLIVGPEANKNLLQYHADWAFLSVGGIDQEVITNSNQLVVETEQTMIAQSDKAVLLADFSKIGTRSMMKMCEPNEIHLLITNKKASDHDLLSIKKMGLDVLKV